MFCVLASKHLLYQGKSESQRLLDTSMDSEEEEEPGVQVETKKQDPGIAIGKKNQSKLGNLEHNLPSIFYDTLNIQLS